MKQVYKQLLTALLSIFIFSSANAAILYVKPATGSTAWQDKTTVYSDLQTALAVAISGDQLWVAAGTYKPTTGTDRTISFQLKDGVELYGGFAGNETEFSQRNWRINKTILSGDIGELSVETDNSYSVVTAMGTSEELISNSTVLDGFFIEHGYASGSGVNANGGGMFLEYAAPIIRNTWFRDNYAKYQGGALYCNNSSMPLIGNSLFTNNSSDYYGGAIYSNSKIKIHNSLFYKNHSKSSESVRFSNSGIESEIVNSILWQRAPGNYWAHTNGTPNYSIIEGNQLGTDNIYSDPLFLAPEDGDFRVLQNSPANGAGNPDLVPDWLTEDYRGEQRITDGKVSMGVYERSVSTLPIPSYPGNKALFESSTKEVNVSWLLPEDPTEIFIDYTLEYSINNNPVITIENIENLPYSIEDLTPSSIVKWRVASRTEDGTLNWSSWTIFIIRREHPFHVTVDGIGKGTSWEDAMNLQDALGIAVYGDQLWVAAGTYKPTDGTDRAVSFQLKEGVELYGGFAGNETELGQRNWQKNPTILSGDIGITEDNTDNSYHVLSAIGTVISPISNSTVFDGFIVEKGYANGQGIYDTGGAVYLKYASPVIRNVWFRDNYSASSGGAVYGTDHSKAAFGNALFTNNRSGFNGGALFSWDAQMTLLNSVFYANSSVARGGAIANANYTQGARVLNSIFLNNTSGTTGPQADGVKIDHSLVQGGYPGIGNLSADPGLNDPENGDFRLRSNSPVIGTGNTEQIPEWLTVDFSGHTRMSDGKINMGLYEDFIHTPVLITPLNNALFDKDISEVELTWQIPEESSESYSEFILEYIKNGEGPRVMKTSELRSFVIDAINPIDNIQWRVAGRTPAGDFHWSEWRHFSVKRDHPLYVSPAGTGSGSSWTDAINLQDALGIAVYGDQLWVAAGTYKPTEGTDRTISFHLKDGVELYGGFAGNETELSQRNWRKNTTILSGDIGVAEDNTDNSYHVISVIATELSPISNPSIIDGFIIEDGYASLSSNSNNWGGGLYLSYASSLIRNTWFRNNYAVYDGGAVYASASSALFANVLFTNNESGNHGGAVYSYNSGAKFYSCLFYGNNAGYWGAAVYSNNSSSGTEVVNSIAWNNNALQGNSQFQNLNVQQSIVQGGYSGTGNLNLDPLFIDAENGDFRLSINSPALEAGKVELLPEWLTTDYAGKPRITEGKTSMGIYEGFACSPIPLFPQDNSVLDTNTTELEFSWQLPEENVETISSYSIEYRKNNGSPVIIEDIDVTTYMLDGINAADKIEWRVASITEEGNSNWSAWNSFNIRRDQPIFVKPDGNGRGSSWYDATSLQKALSIAVNGEQIWVAAGIYKPTEGTDRTISFQLKDGVALYGGFAGGETDLNQRNWRMNETILSGNIGEADVETDNSYHVLVGNGSSISPISNATLLDGFIVEAGYANSYALNDKRGSGLYLYNASPSIQNLWFRSNYAASDGGAIFGINSSAATFENVLFTKNKATETGGAAYSMNSEFTFNNCLFYNNYSDNRVGAISGTSGNGTQVINSIIWNNNARINSPQISTVSARHSIIQGGYSGEGNIDADPLFMDPENGNFMLKPGSPAIDAGSSDLLPEYLTRDYLGSPRVQGNNVDMGPLESIVLVNTMPAHYGGAKESEFFGLEFRWGVKKGELIDESEIPNMLYRIQVWESGDEENPLHDAEITSGGFFATDYNTTNLTGFGTGKTYEWKIAMLLDGMEIWSDPTVFYIGHDHVIHVKAGSEGTTGVNWDNAFGTLHEALEYSLPGDEIWVAAGTYYPVEVANSSAVSTAERDAAFKLKTGLTIYGGFEGSEMFRDYRNYATNLTIISGDLSGTGNYETASKHLFLNTGSSEQPISNGSVLDGLIFEHAAQSAIVNNQASPAIHNSIFRNNKGENGAAISNTESSPLLYQVLFHNNEASAAGGAIWSDNNSMPELINLTIVKNMAQEVGGVYGPASIKNSIVYHNDGGQVSEQSTVIYSCVEGGFEGEGNTSYDPNLINVEEGDFRMMAFSSVIDAGLQSLIPGQAFADLSMMARVMGDNVDMGVYEMQSKFDFIITEASAYRNSIHRNDDITIRYQVPVVLKSPELIELSSEGKLTPLYLTVEDGALVISHEGLEFGQEYKLLIPKGAVAFEGNLRILNQSAELDFATLDCKPSGIISLPDRVVVCPNEPIEIVAQTEGDIADLRWTYNNEVLDFNSDTLTIESLTQDKLGIYTLEVSDYCQSAISKQVSLGHIETTALNVMDKWGTVFFIDNASEQLSDYKWYLNEDFISNAQYIDASYKNGQLVVYALDGKSGCVLRSEPIELSGGERSAIMLWPNPVRSGNNVSVLLPTGFEAVNMQLLDISGRLMVQEKVASGPQYDFDKTDFLPGVYIFQFEDKQGNKEFVRFTID
jgi:predicted outer membrane repeat protein